MKHTNEKYWIDETFRGNSFTGLVIIIFERKQILSTLSVFHLKNALFLNNSARGQIKTLKHETSSLFKSLFYLVNGEWEN